MTSTLANSLQEIDVPGIPAELAVGRGLQADVLLKLHRLADRLVLGRAQLLGGDFAALSRRAGVDQLARPQQAADMIGAIRRRVPWRHELLPVLRRQPSPALRDTAIILTTGPTDGGIAMSRELLWLTLTIAMTALIWVPYILDRIMVRGLMATLANPSRRTTSSNRRGRSA